MQKPKKKSSAKQTRATQPGNVIAPESKKAEKTYTVTVTYVEVSEEERTIKRSIIEGILKAAYLSKGK